MKTASLSWRRWGSLAVVAALSASVVALPGCGAAGNYVRTSIHQYEVGNYNAASRACWEASHDQEYMNEKAHVRYLVYCGLTSYRLGRRDEAQGMLRQGNNEYLRGRSNWLKPAIVDELYKAMDDLDGQQHARPTRESFRMR